MIHSTRTRATHALFASRYRYARKRTPPRSRADDLRRPRPHFFSFLFLSELSPGPICAAAAARIRWNLGAPEIILPVLALPSSVRCGSAPLDRWSPVSTPNLDLPRPISCQLGVKFRCDSSLGFFLCFGSRGVRLGSRTVEVTRKQDPHEQLGIFIVAGVAVRTSRKVVVVGIGGSVAGDKFLFLLS